MKTTKKVLRYTVVFEKDSESEGYTATVPLLPGCVTEGDTFEETEKNAQEAILAYLESLQKHGESIPEETSEPYIGRIEVSFIPRKLAAR